MASSAHSILGSNRLEIKKGKLLQSHRRIAQRDMALRAVLLVVRTNGRSGVGEKRGARRGKGGRKGLQIC